MRCCLAAVIGAGVLFSLPAWGAGPAVEIQVGTPDPQDDYICWAPTEAKVRLSTSTTSDQQVTITTVPLTPTGGAVQFQESQGQPITGQTFAPVGTLSVTLPQDGSWVSFYVAGKHASSGTRDIAIRVQASDGATLSEFPVMVRVRKDADKLSEAERKSFLQALIEWKQAGGQIAGGTLFDDYYRTHNDVMTKGIHGQTQPVFNNFLPWHRALILSFERQLQKINPTVLAPLLAI